jgi:7-cyano-7-deazaguanine synthase
MPPSEAAPGCLVLFSAGQDSATCLAWALARFDRVETIGFDYGQRHAVELTLRPRLRREIADVLGQTDCLGEDCVVEMRSFGALSQSALTTDRAIAMAANGLPSTFVPGRNLAFLAYAGAYAYRRGVDTLVIGVCETDYSGYPDCRDATIRAMEQALALGLDRPQTVIETPLMHRTKAQTWALAQALGGAALVAAIVEHSHTCYQGDRSQRFDWGYGCGVCPACVLRATGWEAYQAAP